MHHGATSLSLRQWATQGSNSNESVTTTPQIANQSLNSVGPLRLDVSDSGDPPLHYHIPMKTVTRKQSIKHPFTQKSKNFNDDGSLRLRSFDVVEQDLSDLDGIGNDFEPPRTKNTMRRRKILP